MLPCGPRVSPLLQMAKVLEVYIEQLKTANTNVKALTTHNDALRSHMKRC